MGPEQADPGGNGDQRDQIADLRDLAGQERDLAEVTRDHLADQRDQDGNARDRDAQHRDQLADQRDRKADQRDDSESRAVDVCAEADARLAQTRDIASSDRHQASADRAAAASERSQSKLDRRDALADRVSGAGAREDSQHDRTTSMGDRVAAQRERNFGAQFASSLQFGWTVRTLEPPEFLYTSPGYRKIMGVPVDRVDFTLSEALAMIHPDDPDPIPSGYWTPPAGTTAEAEMRIIRPDGEIRWIRSTSNPVINPDGTVTRAAAEVEDITDRKAAEAEVRAARSQAERANMAKTAFLTQVTHELRTPLSAVLGFAQLLELDPLTLSQAGAVDQILRGGRHLLQVVEDLLDISRIETNDVDLSNESIMVDEVLTEVVGLMQSLAAAAGIDMRYTPQDAVEPRCVLADRRRLRQVMLNLLSNAVKYNRPGGLVDVTDEPLGDGELRISVRDTGHGIAADDIPALFTMFDRLGRRDNEIEGAGIGLAHSRRLMEAMNGRLEVDSEVGVGSTFWAVLPRDLREVQGIAYWEGDVSVQGCINGRTVDGTGYTEINPPAQP